MSAAVLLALAAWAANAQAPNSLIVASSRGERPVAVRTERGFPAIAAADLGAVLGIEATAPHSGAASLRAAGRQYDFVLDAAYFSVEGRVFGLAAPAYVARDSLFVPLQFLVEYLPRLAADRYRYDPARLRLEELPGPPGVASVRGVASQPVAAAPARAQRRPIHHIVALDPGHGGPDVGMLGPIGRRPFLREKDVTLAVARDVADELRRRGVQAVLTRTKDTLIALADRGRIAASDSATLFVSIHVNAANPHWRNAAGARGFETYFLAEARTEDARRVAQMENASVRFETDARAPSGDPMSFIFNDLAQNEHLRESSELARIVEDSLRRVHPAEANGVKQAGFAVLATSYMPAVLVEIGYGSNYEEAKFLTSQSGQQRLARGIASAIVGYLTEYDRRLAAGGGGGGSSR
ncbi:MAG TPA: N-acetylmuramoyl-L-alanine amidase [Gemmatimonadales bacterium]|nr:N-acetylmuramoyl-L-alanine amidase [Gemmatimonadales bacterium]